MRTAVLVLLGSVLLPACAIEVVDGDDRVYYPGTLVVDWTIAEGKDARDCVRWDADRIAIMVETRSGRLLDSYTQDCEAFETEIDLDPGPYQASAALLSRQGARLTTYVDLGPFDIYEDEIGVVAINFPDDSFR